MINYHSDLHLCLKKSLSEVKKNYDYIIIDCPPGLSIFVSAAIIASDYFIAPVTPEYMSIKGLDLINDRIAGLKNFIGKLINIDIQFAGSILNKVESSRKTHKRYSSLLYGMHVDEEHWGVKYKCFEWWVPLNERLRKLADYQNELLEEAGQGYFYNWKEKYELGYKLKNPSGIRLDRSPQETSSYNLYDRLGKLTNEFIERIA